MPRWACVEAPGCHNSKGETYFHAKQEHSNMMKRAGGRSLRQSLVSASVTMVLAVGMLAGLSALTFADDGPKPDPSGTATGDKTTAVDAAGNPFVVAEPTDKSAPDYAANKKAFDDYTAQ